MYQFRLERLGFKDGNHFDPPALTVILGPNNVGKSVSLKEIAHCISVRATLPKTVLQDVDWTIPDNLDELRASYPIERRQNEAGNWVWRTLAADLSRQHQVITSVSGPGDWRAGFVALFLRKGQQAKEEFA